MPQEAGVGGLAIGTQAPFTQGRSYDIKRPGEGRTIRGYCVNEMPLAVTSHFDPRDNTNWIHLHKDCPYCGKMPRERWYGLMPVVGADYNGIVLFEITAFAGANSPTLRQSPLPNLRGLPIAIERYGKGPRGKCKLTFGDEPTKSRLPAALDTLKAIAAIWKHQPEVRELRDWLAKGGAK